MRSAFLALGLATTAAIPAAAQDASLGAMLFVARCAACHGVAAQGDGPMAALLTVQVADLTRIAARNGGVFPRVRVAQTVDGTQILRSHGGPMPIYGRMLGGGSALIEDDDGGIFETSVEVLSIVYYLEGLQVE